MKMRGKLALNIHVGKGTGTERSCACPECKGIITATRAKERREERAEIRKALLELERDGSYVSDS